MKRLLLLIFVIIFSSLTLAQADESIEKNVSITVAIVPASGDKKPSDLVIANLEVGLSPLENVSLVERSLINKVLQEIHLGESGYQETKQAVTLGHLVAADILLFVEKTIPSDTGNDASSAGTESDILHIRFVESRTGIILESLMETPDRLESDIEPVINSLQSAIIKQRIPIEERKHVGILGIKNNEPGTSLDGTAEALKAFLAVDLAQAPDVVMLDREHLQYLQTEKALTGILLKLKHSTFLIDGGLQYEEGREKIMISVFLRPLAETGSQTDKMTFTVSKQDLAKARERITAEILKKLNVEEASAHIPQPDREGELFLMQVPLYLFSGDREAAVSQAEVAYALLASQEARYWAAWAWYALGWDLVDKSLPASFGPGVRNVRRVTTIGDQFTPGNTKVIPLRRPSDASRGDRVQRGNPNIEFWENGSQSQRAPSASRQMATRIENPRTVQRRQDRSGRDGRAGEAAEDDPGIKETRVRFLSALIRSYSLMEEMFHAHIRDYESGAIKNIVLRDPRDNFENVSRPDDRQRNLALKYRIGNNDKDALWLFEQLVQLRNTLNALQRDFYFKHYSDSVKAQTAYWNTWKDKAEMIKQYYRYDPKMSALVTEQVVDAFVQTANGEPGPRIKGFIDMLSLGRGRALSPEEEMIYLNLTRHEEAFIRFAACKQLMRVDPIAYSEKAFTIFVQEFPYDHPYRTLDNQSIVPDFVKPVFHRMAVSHRNEMLPLAGELFGPMIKNQDMSQIVAWRDCLWPYINGLELNGKTEAAQRVVQLVIEILDKKDYGNFSGEARRLRAELDLKLVHLGVKDAADADLERYFSFQERPYYIRLRPELEAPRLNDTPIDISSFKPVQLPTRGLNTTTSSRTKDVYKDGFAGSSFAKGYTRVIDAEGNETYTIMDMDIQKEKNKKIGEWEKYSSRHMPTRLVATQSVEMRGQQGQELLVQKNYLIDNNMIYVLQQSRVNNDLVVTAFEQNLLNNQGNRRLGEIAVPLGHIKEYFAYYVTALTIGPDALYAGTAGGLIVFPLKGGQAFQDASQFSQTQRIYQPYLSNPNPDPEHDKNSSLNARLLTEKDGLPDNEILSLAYYQGKLYVGLGPLAKTQLGLIGNCGFAAYDPQTGSYKLIASSRSLEKRNALEQGDAYQITAILKDKQRNCLWLGISGNPDYNGIWRYDISNGQIERVIEEELSLQDMRWADGKIVYLMNQTGLVQLDPETSARTWLLGQTESAVSGRQGPRPPKNFSGHPLCGHPETRLWPFTMKNNELFTLSWDGYDVLLHQKGREAMGKSIFDPRATAVEQKAFLDANEHGIWLITGYGNVYLIK